MHKKAAHSLYFRIAGCQVLKPRCLSPVADSLDFRIAGCQVPKPRCLSPSADRLDFRIAGCTYYHAKKYEPFPAPPRTCMTMIPQQSLPPKHCLGSTRRFHIYVYIYIYIYIYIHILLLWSPLVSHTFFRLWVVSWGM